jgi:hypothetical protein
LRKSALNFEIQIVEAREETETLSGLENGEGRVMSKKCDQQCERSFQA